MFKVKLYTMLDEALKYLVMFILLMKWFLSCILSRGGATESIRKSAKESKKILSSLVRCFRSRQAFRCSLNFSDYTSCTSKQRVTIKKPVSFFNFILCPIFDIAIFACKITLGKCDYKT